MARYEHLPVYRTAMELVVYLEKTVRNFSRYQKYGIGEELRTLSRRVVLLIVRANSTVDKTPVLQELVGWAKRFTLPTRFDLMVGKVNRFAHPTVKDA